MIEYTTLTAETRHQMLTERLAIYEKHHFDASQNLRMLEATDGPAIQIAELVSRIADLETCIGIVTKDLAE